MGGGTVWRGVTKLASSVPGMRTASPSVSNSCSFCKVNALTQTTKAQSARVSSCACTTETTPKSGTLTASWNAGVNQQGIRVLWDPDEWEFADEEERVDHLVFGSPPSRTEVEEASSELQDALRRRLVAPSEDQAKASWDRSPPTVLQADNSQESSLAVDNEEEQDSKPLVAAQMVLDWMEPPPIRTGLGALLPAGRNNVVEAFQRSPEVQGMVLSLATDPAVWDAVLANEKIQEFKRKLQGDKGFFADKADHIPTDLQHQTASLESNIYTRCQNFWQSKIFHFMDVLRNLIKGLFKAADKKVCSGEDGDTVDRTVKSCTMLAVIVLCFVILKRLAVQAA